MSGREQTPKVRHSPRISAPKLGEYIDVVGASRRHRIIRNQKFPSTFITARYTDAYNAIRSSLASADPQRKLSSRALAIASKPVASKHETDARACCVDAVNAFSRVLGRIDLRGCSASLPPELWVVLEGLPVSVRASAILSRHRRGAVEHGGILVVLRKEAALGERGGAAVAELLRTALTDGGWHSVNPKLCIVVDVFSGQVFYPPRSTSRLLADVRSACREIAALWTAIAA